MYLGGSYLFQLGEAAPPCRQMVYNSTSQETFGPRGGGKGGGGQGGRVLRGEGVTLLKPADSITNYHVSYC